MSRMFAVGGKGGVVRRLRYAVLTGGKDPLNTPDVKGFGLRGRMTCFRAVEKIDRGYA